MLDLLPLLPDPAALAAMPWWAAGGAALGLGATAFQWLTRPGVFGEIVREAPIHVPGAPKPDDPAPAPWSPAGLRAALLGAVIGAAIGWGWYLPEESRDRVGVLFALVGVLHSAWRLLRVHRDAPAVGEPPPDDPEQTVQARLRSAWGGLVLAAFGVVMALF